MTIFGCGPDALQMRENVSPLQVTTESSTAEYEMVTMLPPDAIPAIDHPEFLSAEEAGTEYALHELVLGIEIDGEARAYSIPFLSGHEIVNDEVGRVPIAVTW